jgi:hypothetical protein
MDMEALIRQVGDRAMRLVEEDARQRQVESPDPSQPVNAQTSEEPEDYRWQEQRLLGLTRASQERKQRRASKARPDQTRT